MSRVPSNEVERLHDLRNAANTVMLSVAVAKRLLEAGDADRARLFLADAEMSCKRFRDLLDAVSPVEPDVSSRSD